MNGGTTNRQCDLYEVNGHGIKDANIDDFTMKYVRGSWAGESYHPEIYELVDKVFLDVKSAENPYEEMKAFWQLSRIQKELDQSTLDEEIENPTSLGGKTYVRKYGNAGKSKSAIEEVFRPGDYIVIRSKRGTEETGYRYYYGIIQILSTYDDSKVFTENPWGPDYDCGSRIDPEKAEELNMKPAYFSIKCQFEL